ncbi:MAG: hypothetical protein AAF959_24700 [Cyanobacteria bacterium P01_D01_bin.56]
MQNYKAFITTATQHDAIVQTVAVCCAVYSWGKVTRRWWDSDTYENGSRVARLLIGIVYIAIALAALSVWRYFAQGKAKAHWVLINEIVDDGLGLYGPSLMGDAVVGWIIEQLAVAFRVVAQGSVAMGKRCAEWCAAGYGALQVRAWSVG